MSLQISNNSAAAIMEASSEAGILSSKPTLTKAEDRRFSYLLMHIGLLKNGLSSRQIAGVETERIMKEAGLVTLPHALPDDVEREWRSFIEHKGRTHFNRPVRHEIQQITGNELRQQEAGAQGITQSTGAAGGFWVPAGYFNRQLATLKAYDAIFDLENHNHIETVSGNGSSIPALDDVANASQLIGENTNPGPGANFIASGTQLNAFSFRSGFIFVTLELLADSGVPIGALLEQAIAARHARGCGAFMMTGSGVNQPKGLITCGIQTGNIVVAQGDSINNGGTDNGSDSVGTEDMALLYGSLNQAYRSEAIFCMNDATLIALRGTIDKVGRPLLRYSNNDLTTIWGKRVIVSPSMVAIAPSAVSIAFFVPRFYLMRHVTSGAYIRQTIEAPGCVERGAVAFQGYYRADANMSIPNPLYPPVALLRQSS